MSMEIPLNDKNTQYYILKPSEFGIVQETKKEMKGKEWERVERDNPSAGDGAKVVKYVRRVKGLVGFIKAAEWKVTHAEKFDVSALELTLHDGEGNVSKLQIPDKSYKASPVIKLLENIDFTQPVQIEAWKGTRENSKTGQQEPDLALKVSQFGVVVKQKYTAANPLDMPLGKKVKDVKTKKEKWDYSDQEAFLIELLETKIKDLIDAAAEHQVVAPKEANPSVRIDDEEDQDLFEGSSPDVDDEEIPF